MTNTRYIRISQPQEKKDVFTNHPTYSKVITREQLQKSKNKKFVGNNGTIDYTSDHSEGGIYQCFLDAKRDLSINDLSMDKNILDKEFTNWLKDIAKISAMHFENLEKHYSQYPQIFGAMFVQEEYAGFIADHNFMIGAPNTTKRLYEENGELYCRLHYTNYPLDAMDARGDYTLKGHIPGPVEALFKLTHDHGFEFQELSTDSTLFYNMFLGKEISVENILFECYLIRGLDVPIAKLIKKERELCERSKEYPDEFKEGLKSQLELISVQDVLEAIKYLKEDKMTIDDLQRFVDQVQFRIFVYGEQKCAAAYEERLPKKAPSLFQQFAQYVTYNPKVTVKEILQDMVQQLESMNSNHALGLRKA